MQKVADKVDLSNAEIDTYLNYLRDNICGEMRHGNILKVSDRGRRRRRTTVASPTRCWPHHVLLVLLVLVVLLAGLRPTP
eukprot:SAG22_NODE_2008_length_3150_cov_3.703704_2_plen_80_part_00